MGGGDVGAAFTAALSRTDTSLTSKDLVEQYPSCPPASPDNKPIVLEQCKFFDLFDANPAEAREEMRKKRQEAVETHGERYMRGIMQSTRHHPLRKDRRYDFRLTAAEKEKLAANGVVASQRMQANSFGEIYYRLYTDDLPVFVTTDSILHAWHRSFDAFLVELETTHLFSMLDKILASSLTKCQAVLSGWGETSTVLKAATDVEEYLTIGLSLLRGKLAQEKKPKLEALCHAEQTFDIELFGAPRTVDFSLFKPRGHYTQSEKLQHYFRAMMWVGAIDFRIAGGDRQQDDLYQLLCAVVLVYCLDESDTLNDIIDIDSVLSSLVADGTIGADSLSAKELAELVIPTNVAKLIIQKATPADEIQQLLLDLQQRIVQKGLGAQLITGHPLVEDATLGATTPTARPTSFALLDKRSSWE